MNYGKSQSSMGKLTIKGHFQWQTVIVITRGYHVPSLFEPGADLHLSFSVSAGFTWPGIGE